MIPNVVAIGIQRGRRPFRATSEPATIRQAEPSGEIVEAGIGPQRIEDGDGFEPVQDAVMLVVRPLQPLERAVVLAGPEPHAWAGAARTLLSRSSSYPLVTSSFATPEDGTTRAGRSRGSVRAGGRFSRAEAQLRAPVALDAADSVAQSRLGSTLAEGDDRSDR